MNYIDLPTYYPLGWFWMGGRLAELLGIPGWEVYQPWALVSLAGVACLLVPVWQRMTGSLPVAVGVALVTTCIMLVMAPEEPYVRSPPWAPAATARQAGGKGGSPSSAPPSSGVSASLYTLYTGWWRCRWWRSARSSPSSTTAPSAPSCAWRSWASALSPSRRSCGGRTCGSPSPGTRPTAPPPPTTCRSTVRSCPSPSSPSPWWASSASSAHLAGRAPPTTTPADGHRPHRLLPWSIASMVATAGTTLSASRGHTIVLQMATAGVWPSRAALGLDAPTRSS